MSGIIARHTGWPMRTILWELSMRDAWALVREFCEADGIRTITPRELDAIAETVF